MIPISTLEQFNAIRYDLNGDGMADDKGDLADLTALQQLPITVWVME